MIDRLLDWFERHYLESAVVVAFGTPVLIILFLFAIARGH